MQNILVVVDMQNDFIDGALGTREAVGIVEKVREKILGFSGKVYFTRDTHGENYMETKEGQNLPVPHCIKDSEGWQITSALAGLPCEAIIDKPTFGSLALAERLLAEDRREKVASVVLVGLCTDICVISNAMIAKAALPEACVTVDSSCCAGVTPESHERALAAMGPCQIQVI